MKYDREYAAAAVWNNKIVVSGGRNSADEIRNKKYSSLVVFSFVWPTVTGSAQKTSTYYPRGFLFLYCFVSFL